MLIGVRAEQFDDVAFAQTFVLQPLIFLGGVFYSAALLPQPFETLTHFNPIFYMISLIRYGFVGYTEVSIPLSLLALAAATAALFAFNLRLFNRRLQAARVARREPAAQHLHALGHRSPRGLDGGVPLSTIQLTHGYSNPPAAPQGTCTASGARSSS